MIREKWLTSGGLPASPGLELLNDIDRVLISSSGKTFHPTIPPSRRF